MGLSRVMLLCPVCKGLTDLALALLTSKPTMRTNGWGHCGTVGHLWTQQSWVRVKAPEADVGWGSGVLGEKTGLIF